MPNLNITLIDRLDALEDFTLSALHAVVLADSYADTLQQIKRWVDKIIPEDIFEMNCGNRVDDVQPTNFVLHSCSGRYEVLVNHFVAELYERSHNAPHYHHSDFVTRILCGGYMHVVYGEAGANDEPDLTVHNMHWVGPDDSYSIGWETYHTILKPTDGTLSLLVRGPQRCPRPNISERSYSLEVFTAEFTAMRRNLSRAVTAVPARVSA